MKKIFAISLFAVFVSINAQAIEYYDDGQVHDISTPLNKNISIWDGSIIPGDHLGGPTTVNLFSGGSVYDVDVYDTSTFNMFDGSADFIRFHVYSNGNISGGSGMQIDVCDESSVDISGGTFENVFGIGDSHISVSGGDFQGLLFVDGGNYTFEMSDGYTDVVDGSGTGYTTISGGEIDTLVSNLSGTVEVFGGQINHLKSGDYSDSGLIIIHGTDFNYDYGYITDYSGLLMGTLASGDTILADFSRFGDAEILLVPEPATLLLVGIGAVLMRRRKYN